MDFADCLSFLTPIINIMNSNTPKARLYQKKNTFELAGKIDYHEQLYAATKDI